MMLPNLMINRNFLQKSPTNGIQNSRSEFHQKGDEKTSQWISTIVLKCSLLLTL